MAHLLRPHLLALLLLAGPALAQQPAQQPAPADTSAHTYEIAPGTPPKPWYRGKLLQACAVPAVLIGYGVSVYDDHGFYSSQQARADLQRHFPDFRSHLDDYGQFLPYAGLGAVLAFGGEGRNDRLNLGLVVAKSELLMLGLVEITKRATHHLRPDGSDYRSFPSGHTAQAFLAASIVHTELRGRSPWYGVGAYAVAGTVGAFRMLNDKHWESDVVAGAGYGLLAAHLTYLSHRYRWGRPAPYAGGVGPAGPRPPLGWAWQGSPVLLPGGGLGISLSWRTR